MTRLNTTSIEALIPAVRGLPVVCIILIKVGMNSSSSAARKPKAGFHRLAVEKVERAEQQR